MPQCFVRGCFSGSAPALKRNKAAGKKNPSIFSAPKDSKLLELWRKAIPRKNIEFETTHKLCELHFEENCIVKTYETTLADGTVYALDRGRPCLKPGSVPTIFPNLPKYQSAETCKRKSSASSSPSFGKKRNVEEVESLFVAQQHDDESPELFFSLESIRKPDSMWTVSATKEYLICTKWSSEYLPERRVVVFKDLSAKIFLGNVEATLKVNLSKAENISSLLRSVNDFVLCKNADSRKSTCCIGYVAEKKGQSLCSECRQFPE